MNILISGGAKNGKSMLAQRLAKEAARAGNRPLYYVATMVPWDDEDRARIERHVSERRGWGFTTVEKPMDLMELLEGDCPRDAVFLIDSVTAILANKMFPGGIFNEAADIEVAEDLTAFAEATGSCIFVSDYIYSDASQFSDEVENYRKSLANIDRALARVCDQVIEVTAGIPILRKGKSE